MNGDSDKICRTKAGEVLLEFNHQYRQIIITMKSSQGMLLSFQLQKVLQAGNVVRGFYVADQTQNKVSFNGYLYTLLRDFKKHQSLIKYMLNQFVQDEVIFKIVF